jgi:hypothetical protein
MSKQSYVYIIHCKDLGTIKIGYSDNPFARLSQLQMGNSSELSIVSIFKGGREEEYELHQVFASNSVRGEWFKLDDELINELANYQAGVVAKDLGGYFDLKEKADSLVEKFSVFIDDMRETLNKTYVDLILKFTEKMSEEEKNKFVEEFEKLDKN